MDFDFIEKETLEISVFLHLFTHLDLSEKLIF